MGDIVTLTARERRIWVCVCGCSSFELHANGDAECAACGLRSPSDGSGWAVLPEDGPIIERSGIFADIQGANSVDFARRRIAARAHDANATAIFVMMADGSFSIWSTCESAEQVELVRKRFDEAVNLSARKVATE